MQDETSISIIQISQTQKILLTAAQYNCESSLHCHLLPNANPSGGAVFR